uniref:Uncharacterized protein n=1 Tax=Anguilla anguilla TaxID=7936 RepID=A0A0E9UX26_ANGAN
MAILVAYTIPKPFKWFIISVNVYFPLR